MGKGKLWHPAHQKPLNRSSPNLIHVITSWVPITKQNLNAICPGVSSPHICEIYTLCVRKFTTLFCFVGTSNYFVNATLQLSDVTIGLLYGDFTFYAVLTMLYAVQIVAGFYKVQDERITRCGGPCTLYLFQIPLRYVSTMNW